LTASGNTLVFGSEWGRKMRKLLWKLFPGNFWKLVSCKALLLMKNAEIFLGNFH
jgi:hypothetical protein